MYYQLLSAVNEYQNSEYECTDIANASMLVLIIAVIVMVLLVISVMILMTVVAAGVMKTDTYSHIVSTHIEAARHEDKTENKNYE